MGNGKWGRKGKLCIGLGGAATGDVPWAAVDEGAGRILVQPRLAARGDAGQAGLTAQDLYAAWWRTPRGCATARDGAKGTTFV